MVTVTKTADDDQEQTFEFQEDVAGLLYVRVQDTDDSQGNTSLESVFIDSMSILTVNGGDDVFPPASPSGLAAVGSDGTVVLDWDDNGESDLGGYEVYRSQSSGGPYTKLTASPISTSSYQDNAVTNETAYYYVVTAVDLSANESAASTEVSATPNSAGTASTMHVAAVALSTVNAGQGNKKGQAVALIVDNLGDPVGTATVTGTFSGSFNESQAGVTASDGSATLTTVQQLKGNVSVQFCVETVEHDSLTYTAADNASGVASCAP
jgi:hypothetical protein